MSATLTAVVRTRVFTMMASCSQMRVDSAVTRGLTERLCLVTDRLSNADLTEPVDQGWRLGLFEDQQASVLADHVEL